MEASEYRIGNWVSNGEVEFQLTSKDIYHLDVYVNRVIAKPIPITPESLERIGFERYNHHTDSIFYEKEFLRFSNNCTVVDWCGCNILLDNCKFIHQLQNLYFALTGKELINQ